ncbi:MAG TPA: NADH-quinone oxidoreductase subunit C [Candidatus Omnitrophota bacterium]|jgi:NADH:ubiquinone oxidoreductase subunit C|nr:MAG: NAD(P)H-quinone oxidoreductase subunit J [Candidatus Omnitrophica bacterium ADurb.Bin314]HOE68169.1 NADH-quinone oxidoreductase subunit C [Candidatus Omnitrophota bacterium]HQB93972.1 NADH-quinone oxidoreductase subunit C [Candidatus Omnitrophota bacterium]
MDTQISEVKTQLETGLPDVKLRTIGNSILLENPEDLVRAAFFLKEAPAFRLDYLSSITAADYLDYLESVYHLYSMEKKTGPIVLRVRVKREAPRVPSLVPVYRSADLQEREAYDTFGIVYEGHPDLRRLFLWEGFEGYPLRKDYRQEDTDVLEIADIEWLEKHGVNVPEKFKTQARELAAAGKRALSEKPAQPRN